MKVASPILPLGWSRVLCVLAGLYAVSVMTYVFIETMNRSGARDFHQFWFAGQFIIQGRDPYAAFFAGEQPVTPIRFLDGVVLDHPPVSQPDLEITPSNTPTMLLLLTPLSYFSWGTAKVVFLLVNMVLMFLSATVVIRRLPFADAHLALIDEVFIFIVYMDLSATRIAIENGQTTLLVFLLMLIALLHYKNNTWTAGLALGFALSKYSLSVPVLLFLLYKRKFKILFIAASVQLLGIVAIAFISGQSPATIVLENMSLFLLLFDQPGVHLSSWVSAFSDNHFVSLLPALLMTGMVFGLILHWVQTRSLAQEMEDVVDFHIITVLFIWTMLVAYHRIYDTLILIAFLVLIYKGLAIPQVWRLSATQRKFLAGFLCLLPFIFILPARLVDQVIPGYYGRISDGMTTVFLVAMLFLVMFLLGRSMRNLNPTPTAQASLNQERLINEHK